MNIVGAMQHTSKQFHIRIMKNFRQHFKIAIITLSDSFTQINTNVSSQVSSQKIDPKLVEHTDIKFTSSENIFCKVTPYSF